MLFRSNPDKSAESALHRSLIDPKFGADHFRNLETADPSWLRPIGNSTRQTMQYNLLAYDALGTYPHLEAWLVSMTRPSSLQEAQVLAIKYEHLWEKKTQEAICTFLSLDKLLLPEQKERGTFDLLIKEKAMRKLYNLGTEEDPRYEAYSQARILWEKAPPFQFLRLF